jgi:hypothetical protein
MRRLVPLAVLTVLAAGSLAVASAHAADAGPATTATRTDRVVVRPVDASGHAVAGWSVTHEKGSVSCDGAAPSAVDAGIAECFPTALYLPACWKSQHHTVLCLRDARTTKLVRVHYTGAFPTAATPKRPTPQNLDLAHGQTCDIRIGGAWGQLPSHPNWVGFDSCTKGSIYGPPSGDGVNRSSALWSVRVWKSGTKQQVVTKTVDTAYFVGTAS